MSFNRDAAIGRDLKLSYQLHAPAAALAGLDGAVADEGSFDGFVEGFVPSEGFAEALISALTASRFESGNELSALLWCRHPGTFG